MRHRYPFDAVHWLRHRQVDRQAAVVSESAARTAQARRDEAKAEADRLASEHAFGEVSRAEHARLSDGLVRAGELSFVADWRKGADAELKVRQERELRAREKRIGHVVAETEARRDLGAASNDAKMIDTHRADWQAERAAARDLSDEEAATEQWTAGHYPPCRG